MNSSVYARVASEDDMSAVSDLYRESYGKAGYFSDKSSKVIIQEENKKIILACVKYSRSKECIVGTIAVTMYGNGDIKNSSLVVSAI